MEPEGTCLGDNLNEALVPRYYSRVKIRDDRKLDSKRTFDDFAKTIDSEIIPLERPNSHSLINPEAVDERKITRERSLEHQSVVQEQSVPATVGNEFVDDSGTENVVVKYAEYASFTNDDRNATTSSSSSNNDQKISDRILPTEVK